MYTKSYCIYTKSIYINTVLTYEPNKENHKKLISKSKLTPKYKNVQVVLINDKQSHMMQ